MKNEIILYDYDASPCVRRTKITLMEKGLPYTTQIVDLSKMQQKSPQYLSINPNGLVPTLCHNGRTIFESSVINDYLEDQFPKISLHPPTQKGRIEAKQWQTYELAMAKIYRTLMYARVMGPLNRIACSREEFLSIAGQATDNAAHLAWQGKVWDLQVLSLEEQAQHKNNLYYFIDLVERHLENRTYLVDEQFSTADIAVYPRLTMFPIIGIHINKYSFPNVQAWIERVGKRRSIRTTQSESEKSMIKLSSLGVLDYLGRAQYNGGPTSTAYNIVSTLLRPVLRKKFGIKESLASVSTGLNDLVLPSASMATTSLQTKPLGLLSDLRDEPFIFYGYTGSPVSDRVSMVLKLLNLPYTHIELNMSEMEHRREPYKNLNPAGELPLLLHGDTVIHDSIFMSEYLCGVDDDQLLFSQDSLELAKIRMWNAFDMGMHKEYRPLFYSHIVKERSAPIEESQIDEELDYEGLSAEDKSWLKDMHKGSLVSDSRKQDAIEIFNEKMSYLEDSLVGKDYLVGDRLTYADIALYTRVASFSALGLGPCLLERPSVQRWMMNIEDQLETRLEGSKNESKKFKKSPDNVTVIDTSTGEKITAVSEREPAKRRVKVKKAGVKKKKTSISKDNV